MEGMLWFPDLLAIDTTHLLPVLASLSWLWLVEISAGVYYHAWRDVKVSLQIMAVGSIPLAAMEPTGVLLFWVSSNFFAITRAYILRRDAVRDLFGIPRWAFFLLSA